MDSKYLYFGLDFLRLNFRSGYTNYRFDDFFAGLSANSNFKEVEWWGLDFQCTFMQTANKKILVFNYNNFPVFVIEDLLDGGLNSHTSYVVQFYSAFFHIDILSQIFLTFFLQNYGKHAYITRFDVALDLPVSMDEIKSAGYVTKFRTGAKFGLNETTGECQTWYLGAKGSTNKKHFLRIYDKKADSRKKSKMALFWKYFKFDHVTRVEAQVNSQSCRVFEATVLNIEDKDYLAQVFKSVCVNPDGTFFKYLKGIDFLNKPSIISYTKFKRDEILESLPYARVMLGYAQNLINQGYDPLTFLYDNLDYGNNTKRYDPDNYEPVVK